MKLIHLAVLFIFAIGLVKDPRPGEAHAWSVLVPRYDPARPAAELPVLNGSCGAAEYLSSGQAQFIFYRPVFNWQPARIRLVATASDLFVCISDLPLSTGLAAPSLLALSFDSDHSGGSALALNNIVLSIDQAGNRRISRADGSGGTFTVPSLLSSWAGVASVSDVSWSAELRIPLALIGNGNPWTMAGIQITHSGVMARADSYVYPRNSAAAIPDSFGDLIWLPAPTRPALAVLDVARISQGLEVDMSAAVPYRFIAGKDTLARAQFYSNSARRQIVYESCGVRQLTSGRIPVSRPVQVIAGSPVGSTSVNPGPVGFFNGGMVINCWFPGSAVAAAGDYEFTLTVQLEGTGERQIFALGARTFLQPFDLRILAAGYVFPVGHPEFLPWNPTLTAALIEAMAEMARRIPVRTGAGGINWSGSTSVTNGVRFFLQGMVSQCPAPVAAETVEFAAGRCDAQQRNNLWRARRETNARLFADEQRDGRLRDRFDTDIVLATTPNTGGGQAQFSSTHCSAGAGLDPNLTGGDASVITQELTHCLGMLFDSSPHSDRGSHSRTWTIPVLTGSPLVNLRARMDLPGAVSLMNGSVANVFNTFYEGADWNSLYAVLNLMGSTHVSPAGNIAAAMLASASTTRAQKPLFQLYGVADQSGGLTVDYSSLIKDLKLDPTPADPNSPYSIVLLDKDGGEVGRQPFSIPPFENPHGAAKFVPLFVAAPLPASASRAEIRNRDKILAAIPFSSHPPKIERVTAKPEKDGIIKLSWQARDPDSDDMRFSIYLTSASDSIPILLASGLRETSIALPTALAPATRKGRFIIEASDGFNTTSLRSNVFTIAPKPPAAVISVPEVNTGIVAGQEVILSASAYDTTEGILRGRALSWRSNIDGFLGQGEQIAARLSKGTHTITLTARASSKLSTRVTAKVEVFADANRNGIADTLEQTFECLAQAKDDDDPDGDALSSFAEIRLGTSPCSIDTDSDGAGDGDELRLASNPLDAKSVPMPSKIFVPPGPIELGICAPRSVGAVKVESSSPHSLIVNTDLERISAKSLDNRTIAIEADCAGLPPGAYTAHVFIGAENEGLNMRDVDFVVPKR